MKPETALTEFYTIIYPILFSMSSDPSLCRKILRNAWKCIQLPGTQYEGSLPITSPISVTRMRSLTLPLTQNRDSNLYANATEMENLEYHPRGESSLSRTILSLSFQAYQQMSGSQHQPSLFGAAVVIAFAASASAMFIKHSYLRIAAILEKIAFLSFVLGFFAMTGIFFTGSVITWKIIAGLAFALTMLAFLIGCST